MVRKRNVRSKGSRRKSIKIRKKRATRVSHRASTAAFKPSALTRYPALRTFQLYPQAIKENKETDSSWLSKLYKYGCMALHLITLAIAKPKGRGATWTFAITSAIQGFILGIDDFILDSPLCEIEKTDKDYYSCFDYCQGRCSEITVTITPGSELSKRAGRYVVAVVLISYDQAQRYLYSVQDHRVLKLQEFTGFDSLLQYPGAISCAADKPTQISVRLSGHSAAWHEVGSVSEPQDSSNFSGGIPLVKILFGYRDVSASNANPKNLYSADEALIQMDVSARMSFREPGRRYIRTTPLKTLSDSTVSCIIKNQRRVVDIDSLTMDGGFVKVPTELLDATDFEVIPRLNTLSLKSGF